MASRVRFTKMHGAGNDFVVLDLRDGSPPPSAALSRFLGDRHKGVGCDQILTIELPRSAGAVAAYGVWNSDGSTAGQCGNGARCVAAWLVRDGAATADRFSIDSPSGMHAVERLAEGRYRVDMGLPRFAPVHEHVADIDGRRIGYGAVSMGNPHALVEVDDIDRADVAGVGAALQADPAFPDSVNVGFAQIEARDRIRLRVFERGAGETLACGSGACAAAAILMRRGRIDREVEVALPGGTLRISWRDDGAPITMAGPTAFVFDGELAPT
ncbi:MAG: diaminopimelate epimerase [Pseudomonadota bacterium]|nr:diaminopimelate epimerase [Pseudomonadota bacterium]